MVSAVIILKRSAVNSEEIPIPGRVFYMFIPVYHRQQYYFINIRDTMKASYLSWHQLLIPSL